MKYLVLLMLVSLTACTSGNELGKCIGVMDDKDPTLVYKYSARNIIVGVLFSSLIAPPVFVLIDELQCPVGKK